MNFIFSSVKCLNNFLGRAVPLPTTKLCVHSALVCQAKQRGSNENEIESEREFIYRCAVS